MNNRNDQSSKKHNLIGIILVVIMFVILIIFVVSEIIDKVKELCQMINNIIHNSKQENLDLLKVFGIITVVSAVVYFILKLLQKCDIIPKNEKKSVMIKASVYTGGMVCALAFMAFLVYDAVKG